MPDYFYIAKTIDGKTKEGKISCTNLKELARILKNEDLILIKATSSEDRKRNWWSSLLRRVKVSSTEMIIMTRNLYIMTATGLSLVKAFETIGKQTRNKKLGNALLDIKERLNKGQALSEALSFYPDIFSELYLSMVKVGEESGTLEEVFQNLASQLEKEHEVKSKVQRAMIYPIIILIVMLIAGIVIATMVIPHLNTFFSTLQVEIPFYTRAILTVGNFIAKSWPFLILAILILIGFITLLLKSKKGKYWLDTLLLKFPFLSLFIKEKECAILSRALSSLISSGVPMLRSLEVVSNLTTNHYFKTALLEAIENLKKGEKLSSAFEKHRFIFPFGLVEMLEVGEETGKTSIILKRLAEFYEQEVISATEKITVVIEPILIIILALGVGIFAFSVIQPMYSVLNLIGEG